MNSTEFPAAWLSVAEDMKTTFLIGKFVLSSDFFKLPMSNQQATLCCCSFVKSKKQAEHV
jgi:hypothetical protein